VSAVAAPRLAGGFFASVLLHGGLIAAFLFLRSTPSPEPPTFMVKMIAAPAGERAVGAVQPDVVPPAPKKQPPKPQPAKAQPRPKPIPKTAPVAEAKKAEAPPETKAGGGPTGGKGADVANIDMPGVEFDYPYYSTNIVRQLILRFGTLNSQLKAEVRFVIHRDGSVTGIDLVTTSGSYPFDQRALAAVEAAANAHAFGPLPGGFREDILPVTFWFSPSSFNK
jgi:TonB family protein